MGKGKRNHKNKKSKPSKPAVASGAGHSQEPFSPPPPPPPHPDSSSMPSTEDKSHVDSVGVDAPTESKLFETHQLPVEKGISKVESTGESEGKTDTVSTTVEAEPTPRPTGNGDVNPGAVEQENGIQQMEEGGALEQTEENQMEEGNRESSTKTPNPTTSEIDPSSHKKRRSRSVGSVETQELKHNHLNPEDIGPQHVQVDRETRELRHIDLEGGEIGYNPGRGDDHDRGSQHHAPAEGSSIGAMASKDTAEETTPETDELKDIDVKDEIGYNPGRGDHHDRGSQHHAPAEGSSNEAMASEDTSRANNSAQGSQDMPEVTGEVSSETEELRVIDMKDEIGYNPGKGDNHDRGSEHRAPIEEPVVKNSEEARSATGGSSGEVSSEDTAPETQELREIDLQNEFGYNPGRGDTHDRWTEHNVPVADLSTEIAVHKTLETQGGLSHDQAAEDIEEAFEGLLMEDPAREQEISEEATNAADRSASEPAGEKLVFATSVGVNSTEHGLPHEDIANDEIPNNTYTEDASDSTKKKSEESAKSTNLPKSTQLGDDMLPHSQLGIGSLEKELGKSYHVPISNDPSSRGDTNDTPLTYQEDFFSERLSDLTGNREVLECECRVKMGDSNSDPSLINGTVTLDKLQESLSCFKREVLESLESRNLLVDMDGTQQDQGQQKFTVDISQLGPRLGKMESDLDFIRKQISIINTSHSNGLNHHPQSSSKSDRASRSTSPRRTVPERRISWSMTSLSVVTALGLVALGSMLGSVTKERGLTDKVAQWLFSEGKAIGK